MVRRVILLALWSLSAVSVFAQTVTPALPVSVDILVFPATGDVSTIAPLATRTTVIGTLNSTTGVVAPNGQCGRSATAAGTVPMVNPTVAEFDDPFTAGRKCVANLPANLPDGSNYRAAAVFTAPTCQPSSTASVMTPCPSVRSSVGVPPFSVASYKTPPAGPTGLALRP